MRFVELRALRKVVAGKAESQRSYGLALPKRLLSEAGWQDGDPIEIWYDEERKIFLLRKRPEGKVPKRR